MPFKGNNIYIIVAVIAVAIIIVIGASMASSDGASTKKSGTVTITLKAEMGIATVKVTDLNDATSMTKAGTALLGNGFSFSCAKGDTLRFYVTTNEGYQFNAWFFKTNTFDDHNPLTIQVNGDLTMTADMLLVEVIPE